jgi:hypothetical protein
MNIEVNGLKNEPEVEANEARISITEEELSKYGRVHFQTKEEAISSVNERMPHGGPTITEEDFKDYQQSSQEEIGDLYNLIKVWLRFLLMVLIICLTLTRTILG